MLRFVGMSHFSRKTPPGNSREALRSHCTTALGKVDDIDGGNQVIKVTQWNGDPKW